MGIWSSVLSVIGFSAPSVKQNLASRSSSNLSSSPLFFIRKLLTNVFSINYCNQSAATFTGQENTSTTVRRPDNHDFHLSNMPSLPITMQLHPQVLLLLLLLSHFSRVRLCVTPEMEAYQAPPSLGFSGQEHWSGLPFPSPVNESEREVTQLCRNLSDPIDYSLPGSSIHGILQARVLEWGAIAFSIHKCRTSQISGCHKAR